MSRLSTHAHGSRRRNDSVDVDDADDGEGVDGLGSVTARDAVLTRAAHDAVRAAFAKRVDADGRIGEFRAAARTHCIAEVVLATPGYQRFRDWEALMGVPGVRFGVSVESTGSAPFRIWIEVPTARAWTVDRAAWWLGFAARASVVAGAVAGAALAYSMNFARF